MQAEAARTVFFYGIALTAVIAALCAVLSRHILRAALCLVVVLAMSAGLYVLLGAEFLAGVQMLVYVGGIVVLLAFAIMLTSSLELREDRPAFHRRLIALVLAGLAYAGEMVAIAAGAFPPSAPPARATDDAVALGRMLLDRGSTGYVLPFEIVSLLLLAAVIGGIVVARRTPADDGEGRREGGAK
jgi:NADH-quinone oxidoreductase subunit J